MFKNLTQFAGLLRNASQLAVKVRKAKSELKEHTFHKKSTKETVSIHMNGMGEVHSIQIQSIGLDATEHAALQAELLEAFNAGVAEARRLHIESIKKLVGPTDLPMIHNLLDELER